jgi:DNA-binding transcriptional ArsR family regulator
MTTNQFKQVTAAMQTLRALRNPLRIKILKFIDKKKEVSVGDIYHPLKIEQSICSQQLKILKDAGVVNVRSEGKKKLYSVNEKRVNQISELAEKMSADDAPKKVRKAKAEPAQVKGEPQPATEAID